MTKKTENAGFQQAAGLLRYFEAEEDSAFHIDPRLVLIFGAVLAVLLIVLNAGCPPGGPCF